MKRIISIVVIIVILQVVYLYARMLGGYSAPKEESSIEAVSFEGAVKSEKTIYLPDEEEERNSEIQGTKKMEQYYGTYQITEFWPTLYYEHRKFDSLTVQEADMMLGRIVEIEKDMLVTYESLRWLGKRDGRIAFCGNYMIEKISIENPSYEWEMLGSYSEWYKKAPYSDFTHTLEKYSEKIAGKISIQVATPWGDQEYFAMEDGIIMYSSLTGQYFFLEKLEEEPEKAIPERQLTEKDKTALLQEIYGTYTVTDFLPTKFYPALDSGGDILLPQGEADLMIGKEVVIEEEFFVTYDNSRLPNSEICGRAADEYLVEKAEIFNPDYQVKAALRDDIYGLRDDMLPEELIQDEYVEIDVFPGFTVSGGCDVLPQLYLLEDGRMILYAMGEYFLLENFLP